MELEGIILPYNIQNKLYSLLPKSSNNTPKQKPQTKWHKTTVVSTFRLHKKNPRKFHAFFFGRKNVRCQETSTLWASQGNGCWEGRWNSAKNRYKKPTGENEPRTQKKLMFRYPKLEKNSLFAPESRWLENNNTAAFWL